MYRLVVLKASGTVTIQVLRPSLLYVIPIRHPDSVTLPIQNPASHTVSDPYLWIKLPEVSGNTYTVTRGAETMACVSTGGSYMKFQAGDDIAPSGNTFIEYWSPDLITLTTPGTEGSIAQDIPGGHYIYLEPGEYSLVNQNPINKFLVVKELD